MMPPPQAQPVVATTPHPSVVPFDGLGRLPAAGKLIIEASAGTGKTYSLATLAARLVIETDRQPSDLLLVTFTRAAAAELRSRIRGRLAAIEHGLRQAVEPNRTRDVAREAGDAVQRDELVDQYLNDSANPATQRLEAARAALVNFDAMTIATIHSFCQVALAMAPAGTTASFVMNPADDGVLDEVVSDVLVQASLFVQRIESRSPDIAFGQIVGSDPRLVGSLASWELFAEIVRRSADPAGELPKSKALGEVVRALLANSHATVYPELERDFGETKAQIRAVLAKLAADEVERRRETARTMNYDGLQRRAYELVKSDLVVCEALQNRYSAVLIDEFQDTDAFQWGLFDTLFGDREHTLMVMVGDPKQAIYGFRGGDIHTYLSVRGIKDIALTSLATNWRSTPDLVGCLNALFDGQTFGSEDIGYTEVATPSRSSTAAAKAVDQAPLDRSALEIRLPRAAELPAKSRDVGADSARRSIHIDVANVIVDLLGSEIGPDSKLTVPSDICVLVKSHSDAAQILRSLRAANVPAVLSRPGLVTDSAAVDHWRRLLWALERPSDSGRVRGAMLSWFIGLTAEQLGTVSAEDVTAWQFVVQRWADLVGKSGVMALVDAVRTDGRFEQRLLTREGGERDVTDLVHLAELMHEACAGRPIAPGALYDVFEALVRSETSDEDDRLKGRSEGDEHAVQIMTVHASKGLEFPIVLAPFLWVGERADSVRVYSDPTTGTRVVDVERSTATGAPGRLVRPRVGAFRAEQLGEAVRLAYVALTRAKYKLVTWWFPVHNAQKRALGQILFRDVADIPDLPDQCDLLRSRFGDSVTVTEFSRVQRRRRLTASMPSTTTEIESGLSAAVVERAPDRSIGRWSFTSITRELANPSSSPLDGTGYNGFVEASNAHDEPLDRLLDEPIGERMLASNGGGVGIVDGRDESDGADGAIPSVGLNFPPELAGKEFGVAVHSIFETIDFVAQDAAGQVLLTAKQLPRFVATVGSPAGLDAFCEGFVRSLRAPLGPLLGGRTLGEIPKSDRLDELDFELPLPHKESNVDIEAVGETLGRMFPAPHDLSTWAKDLSSNGQSVRLGGYLNGSIDLVFRTVGDSGPRFHIVDYKTNLLGDRSRGHHIADYHPDRLWEAMAHHYYPLQATLYGVALHRYLRWRMADYDPQMHLGSVGYLFVRGMSADAVTPDGRPYGVCSWPMDGAAISALSDLFSGAER